LRSSDFIETSLGNADDVFLVQAEDSQFFIGSYRGVVNHFRGFVYRFEYSTVNSTPENCDTVDCAHCAADGFCLSMCGPNQWVGAPDDEGLQCNNCHETCENGCEDDSACDEECHDDCQTCSGPGSDECITCWCNAERSDESAPRSCCVCEEEYVGSPRDCRYHSSEDDGCEVYTDDGLHSCARCRENHEYIATFDESLGFCRWCVDNDFYGFPSCGPRDPNGLRLIYND
jgi:hypothetical protein